MAQVLKYKIANIYLEDKSFDQDGQKINYTRLMVVVVINGKQKILEFKPTSSKADDIKTFFDLASENSQVVNVNANSQL